MAKINDSWPDVSHIKIRRADRSDADVFLALIDALADYEKLERPDRQARLRLIADGFGPSPRYEAFLAFADGKAVGYAVILETYSSFLALPTLYLEDIFVLPDYRKQKTGLALFLSMTELAKQRGCGRMDWTVLDWNTMALDFYDRLGAAYLKEWQLYRMDEAALRALPELNLLP